MRTKAEIQRSASFPSPIKRSPQYVGVSTAFIARLTRKHKKLCPDYPSTAFLGIVIYSEKVYSIK